MAFQDGNHLYQFKQILMGVTNVVSAFQRFMNSFISDNKLSGTFSYLDDITVCGKTQEEHDINLEGFLKAAVTYNLKINRKKKKKKKNQSFHFVPLKCLVIKFAMELFKPILSV